MIVLPGVLWSGSKALTAFSRGRMHPMSWRILPSRNLSSRKVNCARSGSTTKKIARAPWG